MFDGAAQAKPFVNFASQSDSDLLKSKKKAVVTLRWLLVIAAAYLMLFADNSHPGLGVSVSVVLLLASNVVIGRLPEQVVAHAGFDFVLLLVDTILLTTGFFLTQSISSDFYLLYFFVVFLAGVSEKLTSVVVGSLLAAVAYLSVVLGGLTVAPAPLTPGSLALRVFFIFAVALFYGFLVERIRVDREARQVQYVAELESINARLRELVDLKQAFVNAVSHELRTPLNAMLGYVDLVREGTVGEVKGPVWAYIDKAYRRGLHLMHLIEELLSFASISKGRIDVQPVEVDVAELMEKVRVTMQAPAMAKGLAFHLEVAPDVGCIVTDRGKLIQILLHLIENAIKFTDEGEVKVTVTRRPGTGRGGSVGTFLECKVEDTGPGISPDQREVIFEEFRQLDGSAARRHGGMGLGLSVCRGLVQLLRGDIRVESTPGKGATFTLRLPIDSHSEFPFELDAGETARLFAAGGIGRRAG